MKLTKPDILALPYHKAIGFDGLKNINILGISIDSRTIKAGELFIAIRGDQFDGHNFISKAIEMGASGIIVERQWAEANATMMVSIHIPRLTVENTIHALGDLARIYRRKYAIPFIAVGGSNGKTTTKEMLKSILSQKYCVLSTEGNFNNHIGVPQTLFRLKEKHEIAVIEIGTNHPGEIEYLCTVLEPTHGLITNIGCEHLEFFGSIEGVAKAEGELFDWLAKHNGISFVNMDDKHIVHLTRKLKKKVRYGFSSRSVSVRGMVKSFNANAQAALRVKPQAKNAFDITVIAPGEHNAQNALAATAVGLALKVPRVSIQKALSSFQSASKRMQIQRAAKITILNDTYNANPDSTLAALATLHTMASNGKKIAVLSDMLELGHQTEGLHQQIGKALAQYSVDILFTVGTLSKFIYDAAFVETKAHFENKAILIEHLFHTLSDGDIVLIKGSRGMKMEEVVNALIEHFSQKVKT
jgi:UDP-N-acetylmuramoyl-tripeptide--D-alanyl-D-alanine ligase